MCSALHRSSASPPRAACPPVQVITPAKLGGIGCLLNQGHWTAMGVRGIERRDAGGQPRWLLVATPVLEDYRGERSFPYQGDFPRSRAEVEQLGFGWSRWCRGEYDPIKLVRAGMELLWFYNATTTDPSDKLADNECLCPACQRKRGYAAPAKFRMERWDPQPVLWCPQLQGRPAARRAAGAEEGGAGAAQGAQKRRLPPNQGAGRSMQRRRV
jgi:hypothetical protein